MYYIDRTKTKNTEEIFMAYDPLSTAHDNYHRELGAAENAAEQESDEDKLDQIIAHAKLDLKSECHSVICYEMASHEDLLLNIMDAPIDCDVTTANFNHKLSIQQILTLARLALELRCATVDRLKIGHDLDYLAGMK